MRFTVAAGILAQTLPAVSSDKASGLAAAVHKKNVLQSVVSTSHARKLHSVKEPTINLKNIVSKIPGTDNAKKVAASALANLDGKASLKAPCDPEKFDADTGLLSCGSGLYCKESKTSPLGGECVSKDKQEEQSKVGLGKALRNKRPVKIEGSMVECDPSKGAASDADVGVLGCEDGERCVQSKSSSLGGLCVQGRQVEGGKRRKLQYGDDEDDYYYYYGYPSYDFCDYSDFDNATNTGTITCTDQNRTIGLCNAPSFTYSTTVEAGNLTTLSASVVFDEPYAQSASIEYTYGPDGYGCALSLNGVECDSCVIGYVQYSANDTGTCYDFDCTNAPGGQVGGTCQTPEVYVLPILNNYCLNYTLIENYTVPVYPTCDLCADGSLPDFETNFTLPDGYSYNCGDLWAYGLVGAINETDCPGVQAAGDFYCGCNSNSTYGYSGPYAPCNICGYGNLTDPYIAIPGYNYTCGDLYLAGVFGFIPDDECADSQYLGPLCCDSAAAYDPCELCPDGQPLTNPDAVIPVPDGDDITCADAAAAAALGLIGPADCSIAQLAAPTLCGCGEAVVPPSDMDPFVCNICGDGEDIKNPELIIEVPTQQEPQSCATLDDAATSGVVTEAQCPLLQGIAAECCEEAQSEETASAAPTEVQSDETVSAAPTEVQSDETVSAAPTEAQSEETASAAPTETKSGETMTEAPTETPDDESGSISYFSGKSSMTLIGLPFSVVGYFLG